jgi:hypothetical protein
LLASTASTVEAGRGAVRATTRDRRREVAKLMVFFFRK